MPLNKKGKKIIKNMKRTYGSKKGKNVFYASQNKGTIQGVELEDEHFQQHEGVKGAHSKEIKGVSAIGAASKERARIAALMAANRNAPQTKPSKGTKSTSIRDHKFLAYKDLAHLLEGVLSALGAGALGAVGGMATKRLLRKSAEKKAKEKALARKKAKEETGVDPGQMEEVTGGALLHKGIKKLDRTKTGRKALGATKGVARVAGLVPGVGAVGDAAAMGIATSQRAGAKTAERKKELNKEIAGDAAALVPGAGIGTRGAQYAAKVGKAVRGTKRTGKLAKMRGRAGAAVRKHGGSAAKAGEAALVKKLKDKSMEDHTEMIYKNAYVNKLMEADGPAMQGVKEFEKRMAGVGAGETKRAETAKKASKKVKDEAEKKAKEKKNEWTEYHSIGKLYLEMCATCKGEGEAAAKAEKDPRKKQGAYNKARRAGEHKRHGRKGETPRQTQTRRHGRGGVPSAKLKPSEQRALADREEPKG